VGAVPRFGRRHPVGLTAAGPAYTGGWLIQRCTGPAQDLHEGSAALLGPPSSRKIRILEAATPALVLGSAQQISNVDTDLASRMGIAIARRRSGGGAVLVGPDLAVWVDLVVPAGDRLWDDDVGRAAWWVGEAWARAARQVGIDPAEIWTGPMVRHPWSDRICFAGVGPGEVRSGRSKLVGISQRRTRAGALFQTAVLLRWDPELLVSLLSADSPAIEVESLGMAARTVTREEGAALVDALISVLAPG
jgi:lipoate-protein ligase A